MIKNYPKIELHCHLDGSLRVESIIDIARLENIKLPTYNFEELKKLVQVSSDCKSLNEYLEKFHIPNLVMQTKESLERVSFELLEDAYSENVKYIEVRFAPLLHLKGGLSVSEIIESVLKGIKKAEDMYEIKGNLILCGMRNMSEEDGFLVVEEGKDFLNEGVVGIDLCAVEEEGFCHKFINVIERAISYGYNITVHAGEAASGQNVIDAINILNAQRIGHGIRIKDMKEAMDLVKEKGVYLEMCPTSNIQTKAIEDFDIYPLLSFYKDGINICINTDNRTVSNINLSNEINLISDKFNITKDTYKEIYLKSIECIFGDEGTKDWLKTFIN